MTKNIKLCPIPKEDLEFLYQKSNYNVTRLSGIIRNNFNIQLSMTQIYRFLDIYAIRKSQKEKKIILCPYTKDNFINKLEKANFCIEEFVRNENNLNISAHNLYSWAKTLDIDLRGLLNRKIKLPCNLEKNDLIENIYFYNFIKSKIANHYSITVKLLDRYFRDLNIDFINLKNTFIDKLKNIETSILLKDIESSNFNLVEVYDKYNINNYTLYSIINKNKLDTFKILLKNIKLFENTSMFEIAKILKVPKVHVLEYRILKDIPLYENEYFSSKGENELKSFIIEKTNLPIKKSRYKYENKIFEVDIDIKSHNLAIEFNGLYWHSTEIRSDKYYHFKKTKACDGLGIDLIHIFEDEWDEKRDIVQSIILNRLGYSKNIYARNTIIKIVNNIEAKNFLNLNHIQGYRLAKVNYGLYYNNCLIMLITLGKPRFDKKSEWEIYRLSTKNNFRVVGGFSKLFKFFIKNHNPKSVITYSDLRFGKGNVYLKNGFTYLGETPPNYFYIKNGKKVSRYQAQKHKLKNMNNYSGDKTETQIMLENKYKKVYDCGNMKYRYDINE